MKSADWTHLNILYFCGREIRVRLHWVVDPWVERFVDEDNGGDVREDPQPEPEQRVADLGPASLEAGLDRRDLVLDFLLHKALIDGKWHLL